jgi:hypothetical protein
MSNLSRKRSNSRMATLPKARPKTRIEHLRELPVDRSVRGDAKEREAHQLRVLEKWRPIRGKVGK